MVFGLYAKDQQLMMLALVLSMGAFGVIAIQALMIPQQAAAAGCENGRVSIAFNASKGRCFGH